jgi:hypothetical protein
MRRRLTEEEKIVAKTRAKARQKRWHQENKERSRAASKRWKQANPEKLALTKRRANLKLWYGVTPEWFDATLAAQRGCAVCKTEDASKRGGWNVDHDHSSGKTRGVLCGHCNRAIGSLKDSPEVCVSAAEYLRFHRGHDV